MHVSVQFSIYSASAPLFLPPATVAEKAEFPWALGSGPDPRASCARAVPFRPREPCAALLFLRVLWLFGVFEGPQGGCSSALGGRGNRRAHCRCRTQRLASGKPRSWSLWGGVPGGRGLHTAPETGRVPSNPSACARVDSALRIQGARPESRRAQQSGETVSYGRALCRVPGRVTSQQWG